jgi:hypothetical protein
MITSFANFGKKRGKVEVRNLTAQQAWLIFINPQPAIQDLNRQVDSKHDAFQLAVVDFITQRSPSDWGSKATYIEESRVRKVM